MTPLDGMCMPNMGELDEDPEAGEEVCLECVRRDLEIKRLREELLAYRCLNCHELIKPRAVRIQTDTGPKGPWCNAQCLTEYDSAMRADCEF